MMGTLARIETWAPSLEKAEAAVQAGFQALAQMDSVFSTWRSDSEISAINATAFHKSVGVSKAFAQVLITSLKVHGASDGAFDPTVLPLVQLWGFRSDNPIRPSQVEIETCLQAVELNRIHWDASSAQLTFPSQKMQFDFGGVAKGYALDQGAAAMQKQGAVAGFLDLGGGLLVFGHQAQQRVGIFNPRDETNPLAILPLNSGALATSGQYERNHQDEQGKWGHILDPRTGQPCPFNGSVTVKAPNAMLADALATAAYVLGPIKGLALVEGWPLCEGLWVEWSDEGSIKTQSTSGLKIDNP